MTASAWACECVCAWERVQGGVCGRLRAHRFVQCVCIDVWMTACVYGKHTVNMQRPTRVCARLLYASQWVSVWVSEWVRACMSVSKRASVCVSVYVHIISLTILLQYFYTSGRTVSCIIVSLNLEKSNVYLIVLFFVAEKTVQKMYNEHYQTLIF